MIDLHYKVDYRAIKNLIREAAELESNDELFGSNAMKREASVADFKNHNLKRELDAGRRRQARCGDCDKIIAGLIQGPPYLPSPGPKTPASGPFR